jgi:hypothetical protein
MAYLYTSSSSTSASAAATASAQELHTKAKLCLPCLDDWPEIRAKLTRAGVGSSDQSLSAVIAKAGRSELLQQCGQYVCVVDFRPF